MHWTGLLLELNGFGCLARHFVLEIKNIAVWVADNVIDKDLLAKLIYSILYEDDYLESLKLELFRAIQRSQGLG